ncbi:hypothetical protein JD969_07730 [Planctomycetota bacterium]|nr:hypothetical protein JD969_07730 [Planctomycetota bacterium]
MKQMLSASHQSAYDASTLPFPRFITSSEAKQIASFNKRSHFHLATPSNFSLPHTVCSYGFFILSPNHWNPITQTFTRPFRFSHNRLLIAQIFQKKDTATPRLCIKTNHPATHLELAHIKNAFRRMFRLDEDLTRFHNLHPQAARKHFGRLLRSPNLFEDIIKTITTCNVTWPNTIRMNKLLVQNVGRGAFPSPNQLAALTETELKNLCKVGYRASRIIELARNIVNSDLNLRDFEDPSLTTDQLHKKFLSIHGIGPYAAANLCQLLSHYNHIPIDSETYRYFCKTHDLKRPDKPAGYKRLDKKINKHYKPYAPYQFLAYWFDLWHHYEDHLAKPASEWHNSEADAFTASQFN